MYFKIHAIPLSIRQIVFIANTNQNTIADKIKSITKVKSNILIPLTSVKLIILIAVAITMKETMNIAILLFLFFL